MSSLDPNETLTFAERAHRTTAFGFPVIPLRPRTKIAFLDGWENLATTDAAQIAKWNAENPAYNCAAVAKSDIGWVWDIDNPVTFERLQKDTGHSIDEIDTLIVKSSGEKRHVYFKHDDCSRVMGNRDCDDANGKELFSVRAHNKYVVAAGSIHPDTGEPYETVHEPLFGELPTAPPWVTDWIMKRTVRPQQIGSSPIPNRIPNGSRNKTLTSLAGSMRRRNASEAVMLAALREANHQCATPLDDSELAAIARSISKYPPAEPIETASDELNERHPSIITPTYPTDTIDGDLIGELARVLTDGTFIPPQFMRENIKVALGLIIDGLVGFPNHEDLHTREYLHNVSVYPQSGKGESFKRTITAAGHLFKLLTNHGVCLVDGGLFGSGEFMIKVLKDARTHRSIARFDEMSELWTKNRAATCTLEKKLLTLFESTAAAQGSFKNGTNEADDLHLSLVGDFTKESFDASFTGSGSRGSGYLSRCIFQFADKQPWEGDWLPLDMTKVNRILSDIETRLDKIRSRDSRYVLTESAESKSLRWEFYAWLDTQDARLTPRLKDHLKRDALLRAVFSLDGSFAAGDVFSSAETITADVMRRSIEWCKNQLDNRFALFPEDAGSQTEIMERIIVRTLTTKGTATEKELKDTCHVYRAGSGGFETFNRAIRSLVFSHEIQMVGRTRKGMPLYSIFGEI